MKHTAETLVTVQAIADNTQRHKITMLWREKWMLVGLLLLGVIPIMAGQIRLAELLQGVELTAANARFIQQPWPVVVHIVTATLYASLGAFQFSGTLRHRAPLWHRLAGRVLVINGVAVALTGLWMSLFYALPDTDGPALLVVRVLVSSAMLVALGLGVRAVRQRQFSLHRAWMIRAYALAMGAGTQVVTHLPWQIVFGEPDTQVRAILMTAGWVINLCVAEWVIRWTRS